MAAIEYESLTQVASLLTIQESTFAGSRPYPVALEVCDDLRPSRYDGRRTLDRCRDRRRW